MSKRILIVEDQEDNGTILRDVLSTVGYELIEALNGEDGVKLAQNERPDLILMDIQLPKMDGYEATQQIKSIGELKTIPIIAVTSYALSGDEAKARAAGCDGYIAKPFSPRELLAKVRKYLSDEASQRTTADRTTGPLSISLTPGQRLDLHVMIIQVNPPAPAGHHSGYWASGVCGALLRVHDQGLWHIRRVLSRRDSWH